jgi:hypothetical protein
MTTHGQQTETTRSTEEAGPSTATTESSTSTEQSAEVGSRRATTDAQAGQVESPAPTTNAPAGHVESPAATTESSTEESLFAEGELSGFRSRWDDVQAGFVDDPRECVQKADRLVSDVVDQLTTGFSRARSRLEEQWARGEEASTEDLRLAIKRYRDFFERLLAV